MLLSFKIRYRPFRELVSEKNIYIYVKLAVDLDTNQIVQLIFLIGWKICLK